MDIIKIVQKRALVTKERNDNEELNEELKEFKSKKYGYKIKGDTIVSDKFEAKIKEPFIINEKDEKRNISLLKWKLLLKRR